MHKEYPLGAAVCERCCLMQTTYDVPHAELFNSDYPYFSGQSQHWVAHCQAYAGDVTQRFGLGSHSRIFEIGGNDGTLLKQFSCTKNVLNIEPSPSVAGASRANGVNTLAGLWEEFNAEARADLIIANNVMAHTPRLREFVASLAGNLAPAGVVTIEFPWIMNLINQGQFDTIYHEHYSYLSVTALTPLFAAYGLQIFDVEQLTTHGGSLRVYAMHMPARGGSQVARSARIESVLEAEEPLRQRATFDLLRLRAEKARDEFKAWLAPFKPQGDIFPGSYNYPVAGYGAAAKAAVFLNYCRLNSDDIPFIGDTTPAKQRKYLPTSHIPIVPEEVVIGRKPKYVVIFPWNWKHEIIAKLRPQMLPDTKFVTAIPQLQIS